MEDKGLRHCITANKMRSKGDCYPYRWGQVLLSSGEGHQDQEFQEWLTGFKCPGCSQMRMLGPLPSKCTFCSPPGLFPAFSALAPSLSCPYFSPFMFRWAHIYLLNRGLFHVPPMADEQLSIPHGSLPGKPVHQVPHRRAHCPFLF